jgi:hypothetical protein
MSTKALEAPDTYISLSRAAQLSGLSAGTLRVLSHSRNGKDPKLQTVRLGHDRLTTRRWLHHYLSARDERFRQTTLLPPEYVAPE